MVATPLSNTFGQKNASSTKNLVDTYYSASDGMPQKQIREATSCFLPRVVSFSWEKQESSFWCIKIFHRFGPLSTEPFPLSLSLSCTLYIASDQNFVARSCVVLFSLFSLYLFHIHTFLLSDFSPSSVLSCRSEFLIPFFLRFLFLSFSQIRSCSDSALRYDRKRNLTLIIVYLSFYRVLFGPARHTTLIPYYSCNELNGLGG